MTRVCPCEVFIFYKWFQEKNLCYLNKPLFGHTKTFFNSLFSKIWIKAANFWNHQHLLHICFWRYLVVLKKILFESCRVANNLLIIKRIIYLSIDFINNFFLAVDYRIIFYLVKYIKQKNLPALRYLRW